MSSTFVCNTQHDATFHAQMAPKLAPKNLYIHLQYYSTTYIHRSISSGFLPKRTLCQQTKQVTLQTQSIFEVAFPDRISKVSDGFQQTSTLYYITEHLIFNL